MPPQPRPAYPRAYSSYSSASEDERSRGSHTVRHDDKPRDSHIGRHGTAYLVGGGLAAAVGGALTAKRLNKSKEEDPGREDRQRHIKNSRRYDDGIDERRKSHHRLSLPPAAPDDRQGKRKSFDPRQHKRLLVTAGLGAGVGAIALAQHARNDRPNESDDGDYDEDQKSQSFFDRHKLATTAAIGAGVFGMKKFNDRRKNTNERSDMGRKDEYDNAIRKQPRPQRITYNRAPSSFSDSGSDTGTCGSSNARSGHGGRRDSLPPARQRLTGNLNDFMYSDRAELDPRQIRKLYQGQAPFDNRGSYDRSRPAPYRGDSYGDDRRRSMYVEPRY